MTDPGRHLYPFLFGDEEGSRGDLTAVREAVRLSTLSKCADVNRLRQALIDEYEATLVLTAQAMAAAFEVGGTLLTFGNGGSATDAQDVVADCLRPPIPKWRPLPARALTADVGVLTAVGNDVGFDNVFVRQLVAHGGASDIALGFSTSGTSVNVLSGLQRAHTMGMLTIGFSGDEGGTMTGATFIDQVFVSRTGHIPRIQEGHATLWHTLLALTQDILAGDGREVA